MPLQEAADLWILPHPSRCSYVMSQKVQLPFPLACPARLRLVPACLPALWPPYAGRLILSTDIGSRLFLLHPHPPAFAPRAGHPGPEPGHPRRSVELIPRLGARRVRVLDVRPGRRLAVVVAGAA